MSNTFEQSVATVAENRIGAEHPELSEYRKGFTLLDMDEEAQTAFGVYRFRLKKIPAMMPVVYKEGQIEGLDILIVYDFDLFVPAIDSWINYLLSSGPLELGKLLPKDHVKGRGPADVQMHLKDFPYALKTAKTELTSPQYRALCSAFTPRNGESVKTLLETPPGAWVIPESAEASYLVSKAAQTSPEFQTKLLDSFGESFLSRARISASNLSPFSVLKKAKPSRPALKVITDIADPDAKRLKPHEKRLLMQQGQFVVDHRAETEASLVYDSPSSLSLRTSPRTGTWDVLTADGELKTCAVRTVDRPVFVSPDTNRITRESVYNQQGMTAPQEVLVVTPDGKTTVAYGCDLFVQESRGVESDVSKAGYAPTPAGLKELWKVLEKRGVTRMDGDPEDVQYAGDVLVVTDDGAATLNLKVSKDSDGGINLLLSGAGRALPVIVDPDRGSVLVSAGRVSIPEDSRLVLDARDGTDFPFTFGRPSDITEAIVRETGSQPLTVRLRNKAVKLDGVKKQASTEYFDLQGLLQSGPLTKNEAVQTLVLDGGLKPQAAQTLLRKAARSDEGVYDCLVRKQASPVPELSTSMLRRNQDSSTLTSADLSRLNENADKLSKGVSSEQSEDEFSEDLIRKTMEMSDYKDIKADVVKSLISAMNEMGNLLLRVLVHRDSYAETYGEADTDRLEESCKKSFMQIGDVCIFLREKRGMSGELDDDSVLGLASKDMG